MGIETGPFILKRGAQRPAIDWIATGRGGFSCRFFPPRARVPLLVPRTMLAS